MTTSADLAPTVEQFPLAAARVPKPTPSAGAVRPFGMRFFQRDTTPRRHLAWRYDADLQVAVSVDGRPLATDMADWERTTTGSTDGHKGPAEDFTMDYCGQP